MINAETINWEQGNMDDEAYVRQLLEQFNEQDVLESTQAVGYEEGVWSIKILDQSVQVIYEAMSNEPLLGGYRLLDGTSVFDETEYFYENKEELSFVVEDYDAKVEDLVTYLDGRYVKHGEALAYEEGARFNPAQVMGYPILELVEFESFEQDGDLFIAHLVPADYQNDPEKLAQSPEGSTYVNQLIINPVEEYVEYYEGIVMGEGAKQSNLDIYTLAAYEARPIRITVGTENLPNVYDFETITSQEYAIKLNALGL